MEGGKALPVKKGVRQIRSAKENYCCINRRSVNFSPLHRQRGTA